MIESRNLHPTDDRTVFREPAMAFRHPASGLELQLGELVGRVEELANEVRGLRADGRKPSVDEPVDGFDFRLERLEERLQNRLELLESEKFEGRSRLIKLRDALNAHLDEVGARDGSSGIWKWITGSAEAKLKERIHNTLREAVTEMDQVLEPTATAESDGSAGAPRDPLAGNGTASPEPPAVENPAGDESAPAGDPSGSVAEK